MITMGELVDRYVKSGKFKITKASTQNHYRYVIKCLSVEIDEINFFNYPVERFGIAEAQKVIDIIVAKRGVAVAVSALRVCHMVMRHAAQLGLHQSDPFMAVPFPKQKARKIVWDVNHITDFVKTADKLGMQKIATFVLFCFETLQRPCDVRTAKMGDINWKANPATFHVVQDKTGNELLIPLPEDLVVRLRTLPRDSKNPFVFPSTRKGYPYSLYSMYEDFYLVRDRANLPKNLQIRDLRRTGTVAYMDAGATDQEVMAIGGWRSRNVLNNVYAVRGLAQAQNALAKRQAAKQYSMDRYFDGTVFSQRKEIVRTAKRDRRNNDKIQLPKLRRKKYSIRYKKIREAFV